jgi:hypothetical protein
MKKSIRALVALNALIVVVALLMFGVGGAAAVMAAKMEMKLTPDSAAALESALNNKIGKTYTPEFHEKVVGLLESEDKVAQAGAKALRSYSVAMFQIASLNVVVGIICVFLSWKAGRLCRALMTQIELR